MFDPAPPPASVSTKTGSYEVDCIYMRSRTCDDDVSITMPHYLVRRTGYDQPHDSWLPVDELSGCPDKVSEYLFHYASASERRKMIHVVPRTLRDNLVHVVARAERTSYGFTTSNRSSAVG